MSLNSDEVGIQINNPSGVPIARFGNFPDGSTAIKISSGTDVTQALPSQLIFDSTKNLFQVALAESYTFPAVFITGQITQQFKIAHHVNGTPGHLVYAQLPFSNASNLYTGFPTSFYSQIITGFGYSDADDSVSYIYAVGVDAVNLYVNRQALPISGPATTSPGVIEYFVYEQSITQ